MPTSWQDASVHTSHLAECANRYQATNGHGVHALSSLSAHMHVQRAMHTQDSLFMVQELLSTDLWHALAHEGLRPRLAWHRRQVQLPS